MLNKFKAKKLLSIALAFSMLMQSYAVGATTKNPNDFKAPPMPTQQLDLFSDLVDAMSSPNMKRVLQHVNEVAAFNVDIKTTLAVGGVDKDFEVKMFESMQAVKSQLDIYKQEIGKEELQLILPFDESNKQSIQNVEKSEASLSHVSEAPIVRAPVGDIMRRYGKAKNKFTKKGIAKSYRKFKYGQNGKYLNEFLTKKMGMIRFSTYVVIFSIQNWDMHWAPMIFIGVASAEIGRWITDNIKLYNSWLEYSGMKTYNLKEVKYSDKFDERGNRLPVMSSLTEVSSKWFGSEYAIVVMLTGIQLFFITLFPETLGVDALMSAKGLNIPKVSEYLQPGVFDVMLGIGVFSMLALYSQGIWDMLFAKIFAERARVITEKDRAYREKFEGLNLKVFSRFQRDLSFNEFYAKLFGLIIAWASIYFTSVALGGDFLKATKMMIAFGTPAAIWYAIEKGAFENNVKKWAKTFKEKLKKGNSIADIESLHQGLSCNQFFVRAI